MASTDAKPIPIKNTAYRLTFEARLNTGALCTSGTGMDTELSADGGTFADATNEATEIATTSGVYYLDLTAGEMNADTVVVKTTFTNSNAIPSVIILNPQEAGDIPVNVTYWNGTAVASPATAGIPEVNVKNINNVATTSVTTINANQGTTQPVNFTGTGASALAKSDMVDVAGAAVSTSSAQLGVNAVQAGGTAWGSGAITAASIAPDAIGASELAADAIAEIQSGLSTLDAAGVRTAVGLASANLDTQLTAIDDYLDTEVAAIKAVTDALPNAGALTTIQSDLDDIQTRLPVALIGGRIDATVGAMQTGVLTAAAIATAAANKLADIITRRHSSDIEASADGDTLNIKSLYGLMARLTHKNARTAATTVTTYKSDDTTALATLTIATNAAQEPVSSIDPN